MDSKYLDGEPFLEEVIVSAVSRYKDSCNRDSLKRLGAELAPTLNKIDGLHYSVNIDLNRTRDPEQERE